MEAASGSMQETTPPGKVPYRRPMVTRTSPYSRPKQQATNRSPFSSILSAVYQVGSGVATLLTSPLGSASAGAKNATEQPVAALDVASPASLVDKREAENGSQVGMVHAEQMQLDGPESSEQLNGSIAEQVLEACRKGGLAEGTLRVVSSRLQATTPQGGGTGHTPAGARAAQANQTAPFTTKRLSPLQAMSAHLAAQSVQPPSRSPSYPRPLSADPSRRSPGNGSLFQEKPPTPFPSLAQMPAFSSGRFALPDRLGQRSRMAPLRTPAHLRPLGSTIRAPGAGPGDSDLTGSMLEPTPSNQPSSSRGTSVAPGSTGVRPAGMPQRPASVSWTPMRNITRTQLAAAHLQRMPAVGSKRGAQVMGATGTASGGPIRVVRPRFERATCQPGLVTAPPRSVSTLASLHQSGLANSPSPSPPASQPATTAASHLPATETARRLAAALDMLPASKPDSTNSLLASHPPRAPLLPPPPPTDSLLAPVSFSLPPAPVAPASASSPSTATLPPARPTVHFGTSPDLPNAFKSLVPMQPRPATPYPQLPAQVETPATLGPSPGSCSTSPPKAKQLDFASPAPTTITTPTPSSPPSPMFPFSTSPPETTTLQPPAAATTTAATLFSFKPVSTPGSPPTPSLPAKTAASSAPRFLPAASSTEETSVLANGAGPSGTALGSSGVVAFGFGASPCGFGASGSGLGSGAGMLSGSGFDTGAGSAGTDGSPRTFTFGGKRDSKLDRLLKSVANNALETNGPVSIYLFGKKRSRPTESMSKQSQPPLQSPTMTHKQQMDAKATLAVAATVPLPSDSDDEQPPPQLPAATVKPATTPASGGWDLSLLQKSQAAMSKASKAVEDDINKAKGGSGGAATGVTFGTGVSSAAASGAASVLFSGVSAVPSSLSFSAPHTTTAAPAPASAPAAASATGGWGADFLAKTNAGLAKASTAAAEEIVEKKGGSKPIPSTTTSTTSGALSQDTSLLSFLGASASTTPSTSCSLGTAAAATATISAPSSFIFGTAPPASSATSFPPSFHFGTGTAATAATTAASSSFGGFGTAAAGKPPAAASDLLAPVSTAFGFGTGAAEKGKDAGAGFGDSAGPAFGSTTPAYGSSTPAFGLSTAPSANGGGGSAKPAAVESKADFSFGVTTSQPAADTSSSLPPVFGFGASSAAMPTAAATSNGPYSDGSANPPSFPAAGILSGFSFGTTAPSSTPSPTLTFGTTNQAPASTPPSTGFNFGTTAPANQPSPMAFGNSTPAATPFGGASTAMFGANSTATFCTAGGADETATANGGAFAFGNGTSVGGAFGGAANNGSTFGAIASGPSASGNGAAPVFGAPSNGFGFGASAPATGAALFGSVPAGTGAALFGGTSGGNGVGFGGTQHGASAAGASATPSSFPFGTSAPAVPFSSSNTVPAFGSTPAPFLPPAVGFPAPAAAPSPDTSAFAFGSSAPSSGFVFGSAPAAPGPSFGFGGAPAGGPAADAGGPSFALGTAGEVAGKRRIVKARRRG